MVPNFLFLFLAFLVDLVHWILRLLLLYHPFPDRVLRWRTGTLLAERPRVVRIVYWLCFHRYCRHLHGLPCLWTSPVTLPPSGAYVTCSPFLRVSQVVQILGSPFPRPELRFPLAVQLAMLLGF